MFNKCCFGMEPYCFVPFGCTGGVLPMCPADGLALLLVACGEKSPVCIILDK